MKFTNNQGKVVAVLKDGTLSKTVDSRKHRLRTIDGYAFDARIIEQAVEVGCNRVEIHEKDTGRTYGVSLFHFNQKAVRFDFGHGLQLGLALDYWTELGQEELWK